jgi:hypothetical protein
VRAAAGESPLFVSATLAVSRAPYTGAVVVPRLGDREADLARLLEIQDLLDRHPGRDAIHLYLLHTGRRRRLDTGRPLTAAWSPALRAELMAMLGPEAVELLPIDAQDTC